MQAGQAEGSAKAMLERELHRAQDENRALQEQVVTMQQSGSADREQNMALEQQLLRLQQDRSREVEDWNNKLINADRRQASAEEEKEEAHQKVQQMNAIVQRQQLAVTRTRDLCKQLGISQTSTEELQSICLAQSE